MKKDAFTLIELLAVIIILGVLMLIAIPSVTEYISKAKKSTYLSTASKYVDGLSAKITSLEYSFTDPDIAYYVPSGYIPLEKGGKSPFGDWEQAYAVAVFDGNKYDYYWTSMDSAGYGVELTSIRELNNDDIKQLASFSPPVPGDSVTINGKSYVIGICNSNNCDVIDYTGVSLSYKDSVLNGADPILDSGMIPIYFDGNTPKKADIKTEWYNYTNKVWANAILVKENVRESYENMASGTEITRSDILAYLVWIPRYRFQLFNVEGVAGANQFSINIIFENNTTVKSTGTTNGSFLTNPAFTFGDRELNGFWVGKFETSTDTSSTCYTSEGAANCNNESQSPRILPGVKSLRYQNAANQYVTAQKFTDVFYGVTFDSRMMKSSEWGAVAYLSHSIYGINKLVRTNINLLPITGCGAGSESAGETATCYMGYETTGDFLYPQSTTGNITGIFDMSGGAWERVMGVFGDTNGSPRSGYSTTDNSGFNGMLYNGTTYSSGKAFPESRYYDLYTDQAPLGHALSDVKGWYNNVRSYVSTSDSWFIRGGSYSFGSGYNSILIYLSNTGNVGEAFGFRVVLSN